MRLASLLLLFVLCCAQSLIADDAAKSNQNVEAEIAKLEAAVTAARETEAVAEARLQKLREESQAAERELMRLRREVGGVEKELPATTAKRLEQEKALQAALQSANRWVSFTDEIAPIFHQRCLACHNARTAKGRLNMETYASIRKGGESGEVVIPGKSDESLLCIQVEDGSMPQDADPLTPEQIAAIANWVKFGARLDPGVDPEARLIQIMPKRPQPVAPETYPAAIPVTAVAFSPDGETIATSGYHEVLLWKAGDGTLLRRIGNVAERVYDLAFSPDGQRLAIASGTPGEIGEIKVFSIADGALLADLVKVEDAMFGVAFSPDGKRLAACGSDRSIRIYDATDWKELHAIEDHADWVMSIAWSPDGSRLASAGRDKTSKVFDTAKGEALGTFNGHGEIVYGVAFLPDGKQVATSGADKQVRVWNIEDSKEVRKIGGFGGDVLQLTATTDGRLFTAGADKTPRVHQSGDGKEVQKFTGHNDWVYSLDFHPASNRLVTGGYDGEVRVWNVENGETLMRWTARPAQ
jgi:hypothetical protein